jgi:hypothetical protein
MKNKDRKERLNKSLNELRFAKFKITMRTATLKRTVTRIMQSLRDSNRHGNAHIFKRAINEDIEILCCAAEALSAISVEVSAIAKLADAPHA